MSEKAKKSRNRNPLFPAIGLAKALDRAQVLYNQETRKSMLAETAARHWKYSVKSSSALQSISSLKQFGLLLDRKVGDVRKLQLSELAFEILLDKRENSPARLRAVQTAALSPRIYKELWEKRGEDGQLPSDTELEHYLILERKPPFYEDVVRGLIKDFKATVALAELQECDKIRATDEADSPPKEAAPMQPPTNPYHAERRQEALPLPVLMNGGKIVVVNIPRMTNAAFEFFMSQLEVYRSAIVQDHDPVKEQDHDDAAD